jgi:hypothetical protein
MKIAHYLLVSIPRLQLGLKTDGKYSVPTQPIFYINPSVSRFSKKYGFGTGYGFRVYGSGTETEKTIFGSDYRDPVFGRDIF